MNPTEAKSLLLVLKNQLDHSVPSFLPETFQERISKLFVTTMFGGKVVPRYSIRGMLATLLQSDSRLHAQRPKVIKSFATAIKMVWNDKQERALFKDHFFRDLRTEFKFLKEETERTEYKDDFVALEDIKNDKRRKAKAELNLTSLFHTKTPERPIIFDFSETRATVLNALFEGTEEAYAKYKEYFLQFLGKRSDLAGGSDFQLIDQAVKADESLDRSMMNFLTPLSKEQRREKRIEIAEELEKQVQALPVGGKLICAGSFGTKINTIEKLARQVRKLPDPLWSKIPARLQKVLETDVLLPDPKEFIAKTVQPQIDTLFNNLPGVDAKCEGAVETFMNLFLYDEKKKLPAGVSAMLPDFITDELEKIVQNGLFGCLVDCTEGPQKQLLEWICLNTDTFKDVGKRKDFIEGIGKKLGEYAVSQIGDPKGKLDRSVETLVSKMEQLLPRAVLTLTSLDAHISTGQVWLEFERLNNGTFTVLVYGTGAALQYYKQGSNGFSWPLRIEGVTYSKINADFFERFLFHRLEPHYDPDVISKVEDVFEGLLLGYLTPEVAPKNKRKAEVCSHVDETIKTPSDMAKQLLINPKYTLAQVNFEFHLQALMDYCRLYFSAANDCVIPNDEAADFIKQALDKVTSELAQQNGIEETYLKQIQSTLNEIKETLFIYHANKDKQLPIDEKTPPETTFFSDSILTQFRNVAYTVDVTREYANSIKETLYWALGPQIRPLMEFIAQLLPEAGSMETETIILPPQPGVWQQRSKLIQFITSTYVQSAFAAIKVIISLISLFRSTLSLMALLPGLKYILDNYVPAQYLTWYHEVMAKTKHAIFHGILRLILRCLFSTKALAGVKSYISKHLDGLERIGNKLNELEPISFNIDEPKQVEAPSFPVKVAPCTIPMDLSSTFQGVGESFAAFDIMPADIKIAPDDIVLRLKEWQQQVEQQKETPKGHQLNYLLTNLLRLETPKVNQDDVWEKVQDPESCMEELAKVTQIVRKLMHHAHDKYIYSTLLDMHMVANYKVMAILHRLASRTLKEQMPTQPIETTRLLLWIKEKGQIEDSEICKQIKDVVAYFHPTIDITHLPSAKEINKLKKGTLFNYSKASRWAGAPSHVAYKLRHDIGKAGEKAVKFGQHFYRMMKKNSAFVDIIDKKWRMASRLSKIQDLKHQNPDVYVEKCIDTILTSYMRIDHKLDMDELNILDKVLKDLTDLGKFTPNTLEEVFYRLALNKIIVLRHECEWCMQNTKANRGTYPKQDRIPPPPLVFNPEWIQKWLVDENNVLDDYPQTWWEFYHLYTDFIKYLGHHIPIDEEPIKTKKEEVLYKLGRNKFKISHSTQPCISLYSSALRTNVTVPGSPSRRAFVPEQLEGEFHFLNQQLNKPEVQEWMKVKEIPGNLPHDKKLKVLFFESFFEDSACIPKSWHLLRTHAIQSQWNTALPKKDSAANVQYSGYYMQNWIDKVDSEVRKDWKKQSVRVPDSFSELIDSCGEAFHNFRGLGHHLYSSEVSSQSDIMNNPGEVIKRETKKFMTQSQDHPKCDFLDDIETRTALELALSEPSDRINRILGYLVQHKEKLRIHQTLPLKNGSIQLISPILELCETCLLNIGQLEMQSKTSPQLFQTIGEFIREAFDYAIEREKDPYLCFWLMRVTHVLKGYCKQIDPKNLDKFPDVTAYLKHIEPLCDNDPELLSLFYCHVGNLIAKNPDGLPLAEQQEGAIALCKMAFFNPNPYNYKKQFLVHDLIINNQESFSRWKEVILTLLQEEDFRKHLIAEVLKAYGKPISLETYHHWKQIGPWEYQSGDLTVHLLNGFEKTVKMSSFLNKVQEIPYVQTALKGIEKNLVQTAQGKWNSIDKRFSVEIETQGFDSSVESQVIPLTKNMEIFLKDLAKWGRLYNLASNIKEIVHSKEKSLLTVTYTDDKEPYEIYLNQLPEDPTINHVVRVRRKNEAGYFNLDFHPTFTCLTQIEKNHPALANLKKIIRSVHPEKDLDNISFILRKTDYNSESNKREYIAVDGEGKSICTIEARKWTLSQPNFSRDDVKCLEEGIFVDKEKIAQLYQEPWSLQDIKFAEGSKVCCGSNPYDEYFRIFFNLRTLGITHKGDLLIKQDIAGRSYVFQPSPSSDIKELFKQDSIEIPDNAQLWIEEAAADSEYLHICMDWVTEEKKQNIVLKLRRTANNKCQLISFNVNGEERTPVRLTEVRHHLHSLFRFCPEKEITAWKSPGASSLGGFSFKPYGLSFQLEEQRAFSQGAYAGYFLAEKQSHPSLTGVASYLLLEPEKGPKKVLIPDGQWMSSAAWRKIKELGPIGHFASQYLQFLDQSFMSKVVDMLGIENTQPKYFEYDIDASGNLVSENPEAMAYWTMLLLMQGKREGAFKACEQLEKLSKRMHFSESVSKMILPLALVPIEFEDFRAIRMRLFAALEENRQVHKVQEERQESFLTTGLDFLQGISALIDLDHIIKNPNPQLRLTTSQQWFLFRTSFRSMRQLLFNGIKALPVEANVKEWLGDQVNPVQLDKMIEACCLMPHLAKRYREIKTKLKINDSLALKLVDAGKEVMRTESSLPANFSIEKLVNQRSGQFTSEYTDKFVANEAESESSLFLRLLRLGRQSVNRVLDLKFLKLDKLREEISHIGVDYEPPLSLKEMTSEILKKHFWDYYRIAKGDPAIVKAIEGNIPEYDDDLADKQRRLKEMLALLRGGWDTQSQALVYYLQAVQDLPMLFPSTKGCLEAFVDESESKWNDLWSGLRARVFLWQSYKMGAPLAESAAVSMGLPSAVYSTVSKYMTALKSIPIPTVTVDYALDIGSRAINTLKATILKKDDVQETIEAAAPDFDAIRQEDRLVDEQLKQVFNTIYTTEKPPQAWRAKAIQPLEAPKDADAILKARYLRVNQSIKDYYSRPGRVPNLLRFNGVESLWEGYANLETFCESYRVSLDKVKEDLLTHLNSQMRDAPPVTIEQLELAMFKKDYQALVETCKLRKDEAVHVTKILVMCMAKETRLLQMKRALETMENLIGMSFQTEQENYEDKLEILADELKAKRAYIDPKKPISFRLLLIYLLIEKKTNKMIWQRQADYIARLLPSNVTDAVGELLMSLGKTSTIIPAYSNLEANGEKPVFVVYPKAIAPTNIKTSSDQAKVVFDQIIHGLTFSRSIELSHEEIQALSVVFRASLNGDVSSMTKEDAQSLELIMADRMFRYRKLSRSKRALEKPAIDAFRQVLKIMRESKCIPDEAHDIFDCYQELNFPIGAKAVIKNSVYRVIERSMRLLLNDAELLKMIRENNLLRVSVDELQQKYAPKLAQEMLHYPSYGLHTRSEKERQEFLDYVTGKLAYIPEWVKTDKKRFAEIAMLKGVLTVLLKNAFQRVVSVNFDASEDKAKGEFARPADGNNNVNDEACIRAPYEALVKSFLMLGCKGLDQAQCLKLLESLREKAQIEADKKSIPLEETIIYKHFGNVVPGIAILNKKQFSPNEMSAVLEHFGKHPDAVQLYMRYFIVKQIPYWKLNLRSNSQNFAAQFGTIVSDTGTPYNDGTYPTKCKMLWDPGTIGEALHILKQKCPTNGIHILDEDSPKTILREILETFFIKKSDFTAIIDGGALFKGLSNEFVARQILAHAKEHLPHIKAVKFFRKDENGKDQLVWIELGADEPTAIDNKRIPPEKCITYFDDPHGFASDVDQKGNGIGLELVGEQELDQTLQRYLQNTFRMRGLKKKKRLESDGPERTQTIHFAMTKAAQKKISGDRIPTLEEIFKFGIQNEASRAREDNYISQLQKIQNVVRRAVLDKILNEPDVDKAIQIFDDFESVLISILEDDPIKLFSLIEERVPYKVALEAAVKSAKAQLQNSRHFKADEILKINKQLDILAKPPAETMPQEVSVYKEGTTIHYDLMADLDRQTQVYEQSGETENENENEAEEDVENEQEQNLRNNLQHRLNRYGESEWPCELEHFSKDWMNFTFLKDYLDESFLGKLNKIVAMITDINTLTFPIFYIYDLVENSTIPSLREISEAFDKRLWCSNNFIPKQVKVYQDPVEPGGSKQRKLFQVLVHYEEKGDGKKEITHFAPLTIKEADYWRKALLEGKPTNHKMLIYDTELRLQVAGETVDSQMLKQHPDICKLEVMAKFLDGQVSYGKALAPALKSWLAEQHVPKMKEAFMAIYKQRGQGVYEGSDLAIIFDTLMNVHWTEQLL